jgi:hypothetical protein
MRLISPHTALTAFVLRQPTLSIAAIRKFRQERVCIAGLEAKLAQQLFSPHR